MPNDRSNATARREFLQRLSATAAAFVALPTSLHAMEPLRLSAHHLEPVADDVDMSWTKRVVGKHKAVFDSPEIAGGFGVYRAGMVAQQYMDVYKLPASAITNVVVLRHDAIVLAMNQPFWDAYGVGAARKVTHPWTEQPISKNPALLREADGIPAAFEAYALDRQLARGAIVLACSLAFRDVIDWVANTDKTGVDAATAKARSMLLPGIIMQPSGVFATMAAQEQGCVYVRAS